MEAAVKWERNGGWLFAYKENRFHLSVRPDPDHENRRCYAWSAKDLSFEEGDEAKALGVRYLSGYALKQAGAKKQALNATKVFGRRP